MNLFSLIAADARYMARHEQGFIAKVLACALNLGFHAVFLHRLSAGLTRVGLAPFGYLLSMLSTVWTGAQISHRADIGPGFIVLHPVGIVIGPVRIGACCTLVGCNTIGQRGFRTGRPRIGNHFYAGTGAKILGPVTIADYVQVGANAVVTHSAEAHTTLVGVPAARVQERRRA